MLPIQPALCVRKQSLGSNPVGCAFLQTNLLRPGVTAEMDVGRPSRQHETLPKIPTGEPLTRLAETDPGISSAVRIHGNVLELAGRVKQESNSRFIGFWLHWQFYFHTIRGSFGVGNSTRPRLGRNIACRWIKIKNGGASPFYIMMWGLQGTCNCPSISKFT